jgi:hypothetical protein
VGPGERQKLRDKAAKAQEKTEAAREQAIKRVKSASTPLMLEPQAVKAIPYRGLAHQTDGSPTPAARMNFTNSDSHMMRTYGCLLQSFHCQAVVDGDHQVIVAMGGATSLRMWGTWCRTDADHHQHR